MARTVARDCLNQTELKIFLRRVGPTPLVDDVRGREQELDNDDDGDEEAHSRSAGRDHWFDSLDQRRLRSGWCMCAR